MRSHCFFALIKDAPKKGRINSIEETIFPKVKFNFPIRITRLVGHPIFLPIVFKVLAYQRTQVINMARDIIFIFKTPDARKLHKFLKVSINRRIIGNNNFTFPMKSLCHTVSNGFYHGRMSNDTIKAINMVT